MTWRRSTYCDTSACLEMSPGHRTVWVRDSAGTTLVVDHADWRRLIHALTT